MVQYTEEDWDGDWRALEAGADPPQCDKCLRRGYYGPRLRSPDVKYW